MFFKCVFIALLATTAWARSTASTQNGIHEETARAEDSSSYLGDLRFVYKTYQECAATDLSSCLKLKLVAALDRAARAYSDVPLMEGVTFVKDAAAGPVSEPQSENEIEANLPRALTDREDALNGLIVDKISSFFSSHTLQVKLPTASELQRSFNGEERGKKKKLGGLLLIPLLLGGTLIPLALGGLALLAGKALIVSKLALVLAAIIGLKKLLSGGHGGHHDAGHHEVVVGHGGSGWGRSYEKDAAAAAAQNLAYKAYAPQPSR